MNSDQSQSEPASQPANETVDATEQATPTSTTESTPAPVAGGAGPLNLEKIRSLRQALQGAHAEQGGAKYSNNNRPRGDGGKSAKPPKSRQPAGENGLGQPEQDTDQDAARVRGNKSPQTKNDAERADTNRYVAPKINVPTARTPLSEDQVDEFEQALADADLDALMIGSKELQVGQQRESGQRYQATVIKVHNDNVFLSLGGPDEGVLPLLQFLDMPQVGQVVDCVIRGFNNEEGLYDVALPGESVDVEDWSDLETGLVVEAKVEGSNSGGLECKVGGIRGFIPLSQVTEFRIENAADYVGQTLTCVVTEANPRRGNLVLSHRAVLEREREAKKAERLASISIGDIADGVVRKITDFGAFVDIGGLDGLIHISQLSWDRVKHPSEVVKEGEKVQVKIEKIDPETGKIGLSYRSLKDHPWHDVEARFPTGGNVKGTVTRIASFGVFVKLATGIEGLIHVSELAHRRVSTPGSVVQEGQEVEVKVLSVDKEAQRISLSLKQAQALPESEPEAASVADEEETKPRELAVAKHRGPLRGGTGGGGGGEQFGLKW